MSLKLKASKDGELLFASAPAAGVEKPLLETFEDAGLALPYGCRSGSCGGCRVIVLEGAELLTPRTPIELDTLSRCRDGDTVRLACRAQLVFGSDAATVSVEVAPEVILPED